MKYRSSKALRRQQFLRRLPFRCSMLVLLVVVGFVGYEVVRNRLPLFSEAHAEGRVGAVPKVTSGEHQRIKADQIPTIGLWALDCGKEFDDLNDVQLQAAQAIGLTHPARVGDNPELCEELLPIYSTALYYVDSMTHSKPYLVSEAVMLLQYIGLRFNELQREYQQNQGLEEHTYLPIVTSALRSQGDVERLRRRNRNSSENSCHIYGTTVDLTYRRFLREDGEVVNEEWLKQTLAKVLYELRFEGLCYVKFERRQACFHITARSADYKGRLASERICYKPLEAEGHRMVVRDDDGKVVEVRAANGKSNAHLAAKQHQALSQAEQPSHQEQKAAAVDSRSEKKEQPSQRNNKDVVQYIMY